ncbi:MAG: GTPase HflX, partial [Blautia sp.]|nr:GTPase HflX [Clostridia bacterium]MDY4692166.1 GTPase HflX [Blautia sp.]MDY5555668.1 GTPase HflX [Blautia sp.]
MEETGQTEERVILVAVQAGISTDAEDSLDELEELARTAGAVTVGKI